MGKKFVIYLKDSQKAITITDPNENRSIHELREPISRSLSGIDLCHFETENDCLILKPDSIVGIWIENLEKTKSRVKEDINLDDLNLDIPEIDIDTPVEVPPELTQSDLEVDDNISELLSDIEREENELEQSIYLAETDEDVKDLPMPPPTRKIPQHSQSVAKESFPKDMIAVPEESEEITSESIGSDLLNNMGVKSGAPSQDRNMPNPKEIPRIGENKIDSEKVRNNVITAASKHKNIISVKSVSIK